MLTRCRACGKRKRPSGFYQGRLVCRVCVCLVVRAHRLAHLEEVRAYDRLRERQPHRKTLRAQLTKRWRQENPGRAAAQTRARRFHTEPPAACSRCGDATRRLERHHPDYSKPLEIVWCCKPCHKVLDRERQERENA
jgi:hypothetical protein